MKLTEQQRKERIKAYNQKWYWNHHEYELERSRRYRENNPEKCANAMRIWQKNNPDKVYQINNRYRNKQYKINIQHRIRECLRSRLRNAIKNGQKTGSAVRDLGCSIAEFKSYLDSKFKDGMNWSNYGKGGWHVDHIVPLALFDLTDREQFLKAVNYTNLQPLWAIENIKKGKKCNSMSNI